MAEKRKSRDESKQQKREKPMKKSKNSKPKSMKNNNKRKGDKTKKRTGPRLPTALRRQLDNAESGRSDFHSDEEFVDFDGGWEGRGEVYEYEEGVAEEESKKNRRFDPVENYEYELPEDFEDEEVPSDDEDKDDGRHARMLQAVTGMPSEAFEGGKKVKNILAVTEAYPEYEYNPTRDILDGTGRISMQDLLDPLGQKSDYSKLRKWMQQVERKGTAVQAPLPKVEKEKLERKAVYDFSKKDMTRWEGLVKKNREAPTIYFNENIDVGFSTVGAIASEFRPRTDFEKTVASLLKDGEVVEAHEKDGARLLELNKVSIEDVKERLNRNAKMRHLLFRHELKAKHIKKIKSKTYHRLKKKDKQKAAAIDMQADPESAKELARKQEFKRAEERMTLRHKNKSKWAEGILLLGLDAQDEGTRTAITEQLHQHELLTRKMNSMKDDTSSSDDSNDEYEDDLAGSDHDGPSKLLEKAKKKTIALVEEEDEMPQSGLMSLPFMVRGMEKKREAAIEEAKAALDDYDTLLKQQEDNDKKNGIQENASSGRRVFGGRSKQIDESSIKPRSDSDGLFSDSEDEVDRSETVNTGPEKSHGSPKDVAINLNILREDAERAHDSVFKSIDDVIKDANPKTAYDVAIFASGSWKKMKNGDRVNADQMRTSTDVVEASLNEQDKAEVDDDSDADSEEQMIDGMLSSGTKQTYELPSQEELIQRAFAGDNVEEDFEKAKHEVLDEENPVPEEPKLLPGWGQWTDIQQKRGLPSWMLKEHEDAKRKRKESLKNRKDAHLNHVIISEKVDKKAEKLLSKTLPYPFTSKEVFEQSIRVPIGPEFNPTAAFRALSRPEVVKRAGVIIKPIKYQEVDTHEKIEEHENSGGKRQRKKGKGSGKTSKQ
ncbi:hypothetical protein Dimus_012830 [Dionaea muscipula]